MSITDEMLTRDELPPLEFMAQYFSYDPDTGIFIWKKVRSRNIRPGHVAGWNDGKGYKRIRLGRHRIRLHRLAWLFVFGKWPDGEIDHINGNRSDNRIANLRDVPRSGNMQNITAPVRSKTGYRGVVKSNSCRSFMAIISANGKRNYLGSFRTAEEASQAYLEAKQKLHIGLRPAHLGEIPRE